MPSQRHPDQTTATVTLSRELLQLIEKARRSTPIKMNRSEFIREALAEKLAALGFSVPRSLIDAPDRAQDGE